VSIFIVTAKRLACIDSHRARSSSPIAGATIRAICIGDVRDAA
jgi:hypothetical protein